MKLTGKTIVVTGATSGVGYQLVKELSSGNKVIALGRDESKLESLRERFPGVKPEAVDLQDLNALEWLGSSLASRFPRVDLLICNAAVQHEPELLDPDFDSRSIREEIDVNLTSVCSLVYHLLPSLVDEDEGREAAILLVGSALGIAPKKSSAVYCATKAALRSFGRSLRYQLHDTNVGVVNVCLPLVDTRMTAGRGTGKISASEAAKAMLQGVSNGQDEIFVGKAKLLRWLLALIPNVAERMLRKM